MVRRARSVQFSSNFQSITIEIIRFFFVFFNMDGQTSVEIGRVLNGILVARASEGASIHEIQSMVIAQTLKYIVFRH